VGSARSGVRVLRLPQMKLRSKIIGILSDLFDRYRQRLIIPGYITRDRNGNAYFSLNKPHKDLSTDTWQGRYSSIFDVRRNSPFDCLRIPDDRRVLKEVSWEDKEPREAELHIDLK
jgi:hypothetical protein